MPSILPRQRVPLTKEDRQMKVFENGKQQIKEAITEEVKNFCDMVDCVDEPPALDYTVEKYGVKIRIVAELVDR
jgi:hypothetical protein